MGAQTRTDILPYMSLIPVFGYFMRGTSIRYATGSRLEDFERGLRIGTEWHPFVCIQDLALSTGTAGSGSDRLVK